MERSNTMIKPLKTKLRPTGNTFLIHNTREDIQRIADVLNNIIDKVNELVETVNKQGGAF